MTDRLPDETVLPDGITIGWYRAARRSAYAVLRERFAVGFYSFEQFERFVARLIECDSA